MSNFLLTFISSFSVLGCLARSASTSPRPTHVARGRQGGGVTFSAQPFLALQQHTASPVSPPPHPSRALTARCTPGARGEPVFSSPSALSMGLPGLAPLRAVPHVRGGLLPCALAVLKGQAAAAAAAEAAGAMGAAEPAPSAPPAPAPTRSPIIVLDGGVITAPLLHLAPDGAAASVHALASGALPGVLALARQLAADLPAAAGVDHVELHIVVEGGSGAAHTSTLAAALRAGVQASGQLSAEGGVSVSIVGAAGGEPLRCGALVRLLRGQGRAVALASGDTDAVAWERSGVVLVPPAFASMGDAYEVLTPRAPEEH